MCTTCGCEGDGNQISIRKSGEHEHTHAHDGHTHSHSHDHDHDHSHDHIHDEHTHSHSRELIIEQDVLATNNLLAERNRGFFEAKNINVLNLVSSPGSGKTSLIERTITEIGKEINFTVIEGEQQKMNDADRIDATGVPLCR